MPTLSALQSTPQLSLASKLNSGRSIIIGVQRIAKDPAKDLYLRGLAHLVSAVTRVLWLMPVFAPFPGHGASPSRVTYGNIMIGQRLCLSHNSAAGDIELSNADMHWLAMCCSDKSGTRLPRSKYLPERQGKEQDLRIA